MNNIIIGANNYAGLVDCAGKKGRIIKTDQVLDRTYGGRPCYPIGYTTQYYVECLECKKSHGGILFDGQLKRIK